MKRLNTFIALILAAVVVVNSNMFRTDVYANPLVVAGYEVTAAVVSAIAAAMAAGGVQISTQSDAEDFTYNFFSNIFVDIKTPEEIQQEMNSMGFVVDSENMVIDVQDSSRVSVKYDPTTGTFSDLTYNTVVETGKVAADGAIMIGGIVQTIDKVTSLGEALYDYLHAGDFTYNEGFQAGVSSSDEINLSYYTFQQEMAASYLDYNFDQDSRVIKIYSLTALGATLPYEYYKFYYYVKPKGEEGIFKSTYKDYYILVFSAIGYSSDGSYQINHNAILLNPYDTITHYQNLISLSSSYSDVSLNDACTESVISGGITHGYKNGYLSLNDMSQFGYYVNADLVTDIGVIDTPATDTITDGEHTFPVDKTKEGVTVWDVPTAIPDVIKDKGAVDDNDKTILPLPAIGADGVLDFPVDYPLNPDLDLNPALPDTVLEGDNIFDLLAEFFRNFWKLLSQSLLDALKAFLELLEGFFAACFVPPAGYIEGKINELRMLYCPGLPTIDIDSKEIPDITWSIGSSSVGSSSGVDEIVIVNNSFLRNNIETFRSILCGFIWFLFIINKMFALLRYLNIVQVPSASDAKGGG